MIRHYSKNNDSNSLKSNFIYCIYQNPAGEIMLGTTIGAYVYNRVTDNLVPLKGLPFFNWYSSLLQDENGTIWACTYGSGVIIIILLQQIWNFEYISDNKHSLASDSVNSVFEDSNKNLWFATEGGLCKFDRSNKIILKDIQPKRITY